jgi:hypothetical protein
VIRHGTCLRPGIQLPGVPAVTRVNPTPPFAFSSHVDGRMIPSFGGPVLQEMEDSASGDLVEAAKLASSRHPSLTAEIRWDGTKAAVVRPCSKRRLFHWPDAGSYSGEPLAVVRVGAGRIVIFHHDMRSPAIDQVPATLKAFVQFGIQSLEMSDSCSCSGDIRHSHHGWRRGSNKTRRSMARGAQDGPVEWRAKSPLLGLFCLFSAQLWSVATHSTSKPSSSLSSVRLAVENSVLCA